MWCMEDHQLDSRRSVPQMVCNPHLMDLFRERGKTSCRQIGQFQDLSHQMRRHPWLNLRDYHYFLEWLVKGANEPYPPTPMVVLSWTQLSEVDLEDGYLGTPLAALVAKSWAIFTSSVPPTEM